MKKYLQLVFCSIIIFNFAIESSNAKGYTLPVHSFTVNKVDTLQTIVSIQLKNNDTLSGSRIDTIEWSFINNGFDNTGWSYNFCDFSNCYLPPLPNGETDFLTPRTDGAFTLTITSFNNKAVSSSMLILVWDPKDINNPDTISITVNATRLGLAPLEIPRVSFDIFPIPASDVVNLFIDKQDNIAMNAAIYDISGVLVYQKNISDRNTKVPVNGWHSGVYFLSLVDKYGRESKKSFVVN